MKVVDDKKTPWSLQLTCQDCKSVIEIVAADVYTERLGSFDEFETFYVVDCGACGQRIKVGGKIPNWVGEQARPKP